MIEFLVTLGLFLLQCASIIVTPIMFLWVSWVAYKVYHRCVHVEAELLSSEYVLEDRLKRDRLNDSVYTEYRSHIFSPDEEITHYQKAYKWVTEEKYKCVYRYEVDGKPFTFESSENVEYENHQRLPAPKTKWLFYSKKHPDVNFDEDYYLALIVWTILAITGSLLINYFSKGIGILFGGYILIGLNYVYLIKLLVDLLRRKV